MLLRAGFTFSNASGPPRALRERADTFLYEADYAEPDPECIDLWIHRDRTEGGRMGVSVDGDRLERLVAASGDPHLAARVCRTEDAKGDVDALVAAFALTFPTKSN